MGWEGCLEKKNGHMIQQPYPWTSTRTEDRASERWVHTFVQSSTRHSSQKVETT